jgi:hypothetical protein
MKHWGRLRITSTPYSSSNPVEQLQKIPLPSPLKHLPSPSDVTIATKITEMQLRVTSQHCQGTCKSLCIESGTNNAGKQRSNQGDDGGVSQDPSPSKCAHEGPIRCETSQELGIIEPLCSLQKKNAMMT